MSHYAIDQWVDLNRGLVTGNDALEMRANAESRATEIRGQGEAEAANALAVFQQEPALANFIFDLDALQDSLKERSTLIFDQNTPPFNLLTGVSTNLLKPK